MNLYKLKAAALVLNEVAYEAVHRALSSRIDKHLIKHSVELINDADGGCVGIRHALHSRTLPIFIILVYGDGEEIYEVRHLETLLKFHHELLVK